MTNADLVLEGGGVKGAGLVGAISVLANQPDPYSFRRVAGTSAGAIVASMLAAGLGIDEMTNIMMELDFSQFEDESRIFKHFRQVGEGFGLIFHEGLFKGEFMHDWIAQILASKGVTTWGDLKQDDPDSALPSERRYKLVVIVSDISRGRLLHLPWDYRSLLGVDPDSQPVADAVRASAGIPFFFRPFHMRADPEVTDGHGEILCTDGGMLSNFPIDIFDQTDRSKSRWPTFGIKLSAREPIADATWNPNADALELAKSLIATMQNAHDQAHIDDPTFASRTIFVDTTGYKATDFHLTDADKDVLLANGKQAAQTFLGKWDWESWKKGEYATLL